MQGQTLVEITLKGFCFDGFITFNVDMFLPGYVFIYITIPRYFTDLFWNALFGFFFLGG